MNHISQMPLPTAIASCNDTDEEKDLVLSIIEDYQKQIRDLVGIDVRVADWKSLRDNVTRRKGEAFQDFIIREMISECKLFILILAARSGTNSGNHKRKNIEREIDEAIALKKQNHDVKLLAFVKDVATGGDLGPQMLGVMAMRKKLEKAEVIYTKYSDTADFCKLFCTAFYKHIAELKVRTPKHSSLRSFFSLGRSELKRPQYDIMITYPPISRETMGELDSRSFWQRRLVPNLVFEDYKALQKVEKCLRMIGIRNFKICSTANLAEDHQFINRFYICLPRNMPANELLKQYYHQKMRFGVCAQLDGKNYFKWKRSGEWQTIKSPLEKYLVSQRSAISGLNEWSPQLRNVIAKDYAVLARFSNNRLQHIISPNRCKDFFLGGIRGLGTWGAAWFIDRKFKFFEEIEENADIQILLEVIYSNGRIFDVIDVSDRPQAYFDKENSDERIETLIKQHRSNSLLPE